MKREMRRNQEEKEQGLKEKDQEGEKHETLGKTGISRKEKKEKKHKCRKASDRPSSPAGKR